VSVTHPLQQKTHLLTRLFSIHPGEEKKALLLYGLHFAFWLGLRWGDTASYTLFLNDRGAAGLSTMFIGNAALAFIIGLVYSSFADRISNERLLLILIGLTILWLVSVQVLLLSDVYSGPGSVVYPYFYLVFGAVADLTALHILNYIGDFYDTRAAKRALPFLLSAGFAGAIVAGISIQYLALEYIPLTWIVCLVVMIGFVMLVRRQLASDVPQIKQIRRASRAQKESNLENLRAGFRFVRASGILRWLALSTLVLVVLMKLLTFQASQVFAERFSGDPEALKDFNGNIGWISNVVGLILPSLVFRPILSHLGVGTTYIIFPLITLLSAGALGYSSNMGTATLGWLTDRTIKKVFRNPVDAMLYNSVPPHVKNRARGFVNGIVAPLGALLAGLVLLAMQAGWFRQEVLAALGVLISAVYVLIALRVRKEYGHALADMLTEDELSIFRVASQADSEWLDPATLRLLYDKLDAVQDDDALVVLADLLYDLQGRESFDRLRQLAMQRGPQVRISIIRMLTQDWIGDPAIHELCVAGLSDPNAEVRRAAVIALAETPGAAHDESLLSHFRARLNDPDETIQASVIPPLMSSGDFHYVAPAVSALSGWLSFRASAHHRTLGLRVLFKTGDERMARTLVRHLNDQSPPVRRQAAEILGDLIVRSSNDAFRRWGLDTLRKLLSDADVSVRLTAVASLGQIQSTEASRTLLIAISDQSFEVRRRACAAIHADWNYPITIRSELEQALDSDNPYLSESAAFMLARVRRRRVRLHAQLRVGEHIEKLITNAYRFHLRYASLPPSGADAAGVRLLITTLQEEANLLIERAFWLMHAIGDEAKVNAVQQSLRSDDPLTRINAIETLETVASPRIARLLAPLYDDAPLAKLVQIGRDVLELPVPSLWEVVRQTWPQLTGKTTAQSTDQYPMAPDRRAWLAAVTLYAILGIADRESVTLTAQTMLDADDPILRETAQLALARLGSTDEPAANMRTLERPMLTVIEKVLSLKKVPAFQNMSTDELRLLADISEEAVYADAQQILAEGEQGDALYIIVNGKVAIQRQTPEASDPHAVTHLATLGPGEYFAEMSLFDDEPHSADAVALESTALLLVRREPLIAVIKQKPELAIGLFRVLSQRLRRANEIIAQRASTRADCL
jgi:CRP/FNR family cyclic AMP-dependent transcriptional regulator